MENKNFTWFLGGFNTTTIYLWVKLDHVSRVKIPWESSKPPPTTSRLNDERRETKKTGGSSVGLIGDGPPSVGPGGKPDHHQHEQQGRKAPHTQNAQIVVIFAPPPTHKMHKLWWWIFSHRFFAGLPSHLFPHLWGSLTSQILPGCSFGIGTARHLGPKAPVGILAEAKEFGKLMKQTNKQKTDILRTWRSFFRKFAIQCVFLWDRVSCAQSGLANIVTCNFPPAWSSALERLSNISNWIWLVPCSLKTPW